jgi:hypothetical protein
MEGPRGEGGGAAIARHNRRTAHSTQHTAQDTQTQHRRRQRGGGWRLGSSPPVARLIYPWCQGAPRRGARLPLLGQLHVIYSGLKPPVAQLQGDGLSGRPAVLLRAQSCEPPPIASSRLGITAY